MEPEWRKDFVTWFSPMVANVMSTLLFLLIATIPLSIAGMLGFMFYWVQDRRAPLFSVFFATIRRTWLKCYLLFTLDLIIGGFIALNALIFTSTELTNIIALVSLSITLLTTVIFVAANIPAWVMVSTWDAPLGRTLPFAIKLVFAQPLQTIGLGIMFVLVFVISSALPSAVLVVLSGAIAGYIACRGTISLVQKYIPRDEFKLLDVL